MTMPFIVLAIWVGSGIIGALLMRYSEGNPEWGKLRESLTYKGLLQMSLGVVLLGSALFVMAVLAYIEGNGLLDKKVFKKKK